MERQNPSCGCELCRLQRDMHSGRLNRRQLSAFTRMWNRMETAETDLSMLKLHAERDERFLFAGRYWVPITTKGGAECACKTNREGKRGGGACRPSGVGKDLRREQGAGTKTPDHTQVVRRLAEEEGENLGGVPRVPGLAVKGRKATGGRAMPKKVEEALEKSAAKKGLKGEAKDRYVYGTMSKKGLMNKGGKK